MVCMQVRTLQEAMWNLSDKTSRHMHGLEQTLTQVQQEHRCHREESWSQGQFVMGHIQMMNQMADADTKKCREKEATVIGSLGVVQREVGVDTETVIVEEK